MNKKRRKQIEKKIAGLEAQREKHLVKIDTMEGRKDTTHDYWKGEVARIGDQIEDLEIKRDE